MEFRDNEAIYQQIASFVCDNILSGKWSAGQKILSVRDLAIALEVNPNTVMRSYEFLQGLEIVYNKRGLGLFVADDGLAKVKAYRKRDFAKQYLPELFKNMYLLNISINEIDKQYQDFLNKQARSEKMMRTMRTSNKYLITALILLTVTLVLYDLSIKAEYQKGDFRDPYRDYKILNFKNFRKINLRSGTAVNLRITRGPFKVSVEPSAREFVRIAQEGDRLSISAEYKDHYRNLAQVFVLLVSCPDLTSLTSDARYLVGDREIVDSTASESGFRHTLIKGFSGDSLQISTRNASDIRLENNRFNNVIINAGQGANTGSLITIGGGNHFRSSSLDIKNKSTLRLEQPTGPSLHYHIADSAKLILNGTMTKTIFKSSQP